MRIVPFLQMLDAHSDLVRFGPGLLHLHEVTGNIVSKLVPRRVIVSRAGDDQRGTGFVNEDGVHFVDDDKVTIFLNLLAC